MSWITSLFGSIFAGLGWIVLGVAVVVAVALNIFRALIPSWVAPLIIVALGAAFIGATSAKDAQIASLKSGHAAYKSRVQEATTKAHQAALTAERAITAREQALTATIDQQDKEARDAQAAYKTRLARADASAASLRKQLARLTAHYRDQAGAASATASDSPPAGDAIGVLADVLGRCDARAGVYARAADEAHAAGAQCERAYDAARAALNTGGLGLKAGAK